MTRAAVAGAVVDVIVPVRDGGERLRSCLGALREQSGVTTRIIVVDNGSTDGSLAVAEELADVVLVEPRPGSYAARNRGIGAATAAIVAFTDADCIPAPTWLSTALAVLDGGGDLCAGSIVHDPATTWVGRFDQLCYLDQQAYVADWHFGATANLVVRRSVLTSLGGFLDELVSGGDVDFGRRATAAGFRLEFAADSVVRHEARATLAGVTKKAWRHGRGHAQLARRQADAPWPWGWRRLVPSPSVIRRHWRRPTVLLLALWHDLVTALGHLHERRRGRRADPRGFVLVSSWWPTEDEPAAYPFIVDHLEALRGLGEVEAWAVRPGIRRPKIGTAPVPSLGIDVRRVPVPWRFVLRPGGSRLLEVLGTLHGWRTHRRDAVVVHSSEFAGPWAVGLARAWRAPLVFVEHRSDVALGTATPAQEEQLTTTARHADVVAAVSENLRGPLERARGFGSVVLIANPVPERLFAPSPPPAAQPTVLVQVADFRRVKGHQLLVDALQLLPRAELDDGLRLRLVGDGPTRPAIEAAVHAAGLDHLVVFTGKRSRPEVAEELRRAHALLLTSISENQPVAVLESLAVGRPVIVPDVGGCAALVAPGDGLVYERSALALANALRAAYTQTWDVRSWAPRAAAAMQGHSTSAVTSSYAELLLGAADGAGLIAIAR